MSLFLGQESVGGDGVSVLLGHQAAAPRGRGNLSAHPAWLWRAVPARRGGGAGTDGRCFRVYSLFYLWNFISGITGTTHKLSINLKIKMMKKSGSDDKFS